MIIFYSIPVFGGFFFLLCFSFSFITSYSASHRLLVHNRLIEEIWRKGLSVVLGLLNQWLGSPDRGHHHLLGQWSSYNLPYTDMASSFQLKWHILILLLPVSCIEIISSWHSCCCPIKWLNTVIYLFYVPIFIVSTIWVNKQFVLHKAQIIYERVSGVLFFFFGVYCRQIACMQTGSSFHKKMVVLMMFLVIYEK